MASNPPAACCYRGVKHEGTATGEVTNFAGYEAYVKYPENKSVEKSIIIIPDVVGHKFINAQLVADQFAANGYFVVMPDPFYGDAIPLNRPDGFDFQKWFTGAYGEKKVPHVPDTVDPIVEATIKELKVKGAKRIGGVGYCFGAKYVVRFLTPEKGIDVGYGAHPSFVEAAELEKIKNPLSIGAAETDSIFPKEKRHESEDILERIKVPYQINLYSGVSHGFAVRGDPNEPVQKYAKENTFLQAVSWFQQWL